MTQSSKRRINESIATGVDLTNRMTLEEPGAPYSFDMMKAMADEIPQLCSVEDLVKDLKGASAADEQVILSNYGKRLMSVVIELADGKYLDRPGQIIEKVAAQTGIWFPDSFRRYVELAILGSKPIDRWNVIRATRGEVIAQVYNCSVLDKLKAEGALRSNTACASLCLSCFGAAANKIGRQVNMEARKHLSNDKMCEFYFTPGS